MLAGAGVLYVAVKEEGVHMYNASTGSSLGTIACNSCIGLTYDRATDAIFLGSNGDNTVSRYSVSERKSDARGIRTHATTVGPCKYGPPLHILHTPHRGAHPPLKTWFWL